MTEEKYVMSQAGPLKCVHGSEEKECSLMALLQEIKCILLRIEGIADNARDGIYNISGEIYDSRR